MTPLWQLPDHSNPAPWTGFRIQTSLGWPFQKGSRLVGREGVEPPQLSRRFYSPIVECPGSSMDVQREYKRALLVRLDVCRCPWSSTLIAVGLLSVPTNPS